MSKKASTTASRRSAAKLLRSLKKQATAAKAREQRFEDAWWTSLPRNDDLELSLLLLFAHGREPRAKLRMHQALFASQLMSLAAPTGERWDPYDVKPQIFALDTSMALPVFTSLGYMQQFCYRFDYLVRDPTGRMWCAPDEERVGIPARESKPIRQDTLLWEKATARGGWKVARSTPLHIYGPPVVPHFTGYFAQMRTMLETLSIVPESVDIVVNPATPLSMVISRNITKSILSQDYLLRQCYADVEAELCREFSSFLAKFCPEVTTGKSLSLPRPSPDGTPEHMVTFEIFLVLHSEHPDHTRRVLAWGKHNRLLIGHVDLQILMADEVTDPMITNGASTFYEQSMAQYDAVVGGTAGGVAAPSATTGGMQPLAGGKCVRVSAVPHPANVEGEPENFFSEAHSAFAASFR